MVLSSEWACQEKLCHKCPLCASFSSDTVFFYNSFTGIVSIYKVKVGPCSQGTDIRLDSFLIMASWSFLGFLLSTLRPSAVFSSRHCFGFRAFSDALLGPPACLVTRPNPSLASSSVIWCWRLLHWPSLQSEATPSKGDLTASCAVHGQIKQRMSFLFLSF